MFEKTPPGDGAVDRAGEDAGRRCGWDVDRLWVRAGRRTGWAGRTGPRLSTGCGRQKVLRCSAGWNHSCVVRAHVREPQAGERRVDSTVDEIVRPVWTLWRTCGPTPNGSFAGRGRSVLVIVVPAAAL